MLRLGVPAFAVRWLAGEMADELLLQGQRVVPARLLDDGFEFQYPTLNEALQALMSLSSGGCRPADNPKTPAALRPESSTCEARIAQAASPILD